MSENNINSRGLIGFFNKALFFYKIGDCLNSLKVLEKAIKYDPTNELFYSFQKFSINAEQIMICDASLRYRIDNQKEYFILMKLQQEEKPMDYIFKSG
ncbi:MAG: hypothetical protein ACTSVV_07330 [Promethearchaeota archaeon]